MNNVKQTFEKWQSLQKEERKLYNSIDKKVISVAKRYIKAYQESGFGWPTCQGRSFFNWQADDELIWVRWEESWAYGGEDSGTFEFPIKFLWDDDALKEHEKTILKEIKHKEKDKQDRQEKKERLQLQKLSRKYPNKGAET